MARRAAVEVQREKQLAGFLRLARDEDRLPLLLPALEKRLSGKGAPGTVTRELLLSAIQNLIDRESGDETLQVRYLRTMETMMAYKSVEVLNGRWGLIYTDLDNPFVLGDAPVVTWKRLPNNELLYGEGFARPDVEALLPVASTACLHILPDVPRSELPRVPTVMEVNLAQAAFASRKCYAATRSDVLNAALQPRLGTCRIGFEGFVPGRMDYEQVAFDLLTNQK